MVVSILALIIAIGGTAVAGSGALNKKEKKQTRNIAADQVRKLAPGLSVASANTANSANNSNSATNANRLEGSTLAEVAPGEFGFLFSCVLTTSFQTCGSFDLTLNRPADVMIVATTQWHSPDAAGTSVGAHCQIRQGPSLSSGNVSMGSTAHDTNADQPRTFAMTAAFVDTPAGTSTFELRCLEDAGNVVLEDTRIFGVVATS